MLNFYIGALICGAVLLIIYFVVFNHRKIRDYRSREQVARLIGQKNFEYLLIDIREESDFIESHIPTAVNIPFNKLIGSLPVENMFLTIIVYGGRGRECAKAVNYLSRDGYFNVTAFGAFSRWRGECESET